MGPCIPLINTDKSVSFETGGAFAQLSYVFEYGCCERATLIGQNLGVPDFGTNLIGQDRFVP